MRDTFNPFWDRIFRSILITTSGQGMNTINSGWTIVIIGLSISKLLGRRRMNQSFYRRYWVSISLKMSSRNKWVRHFSILLLGIHFSWFHASTFLDLLCLQRLYNPLMCSPRRRKATQIATMAERRARKNGKRKTKEDGEK